VSVITGQMRAVLLDGRDRQDGEGPFRIERPEILAL